VNRTLLPVRVIENAVAVQRRLSGAGMIDAVDLLRWPGVVPAGAVTQQAAITMDWTATFLEAAGAEAAAGYPLDGVSLLPTLAKPDAAFERELFWRMKYRSQKAMRSGEWKYLSIEGEEFVFNLAFDERERANHAKREPGRLAAMRSRYADWESTLPQFPEATFSVPATKSDLATPSS